MSKRRQESVTQYIKFGINNDNVYKFFDKRKYKVTMEDRKTFAQIVLQYLQITMI